MAVPTWRRPKLQAATLAPPQLHAICPIREAQTITKAAAIAAEPASGEACCRSHCSRWGPAHCAGWKWRPTNFVALCASSRQCLLTCQLLMPCRCRILEKPSSQPVHRSSSIGWSTTRQARSGKQFPFYVPVRQNIDSGASYHELVRRPSAAGAIANYRGIRAAGATALARQNQCLWIGPWGHDMPRTVVNGAGRLGEIHFGLDASPDLDVVQLGWFDRWLKNEEHGWRYKTPVPVSSCAWNKRLGRMRRTGL